MAHQDSFMSDDGDANANLRKSRSAKVYKELLAIHHEIAFQLDKYNELLNNDVKIQALLHPQQLKSPEEIIALAQQMKAERDSLLAATGDLNQSTGIALSLIDQLSSNVRGAALKQLEEKEAKHSELVMKMCKQFDNLQVSYNKLRQETNTTMQQEFLPELSFTLIGMHSGNRETPQEYPPTPDPGIATRTRTRQASVQQPYPQNVPVAHEAPRGTQNYQAQVNTGAADMLRHVVGDMKLPHYNGDPGMWDEFWELFQVLVHNTDNENVLKFWALKNAVTDKAADVIRRYKTDGSTYNEAVEALKKNFGNPETRLQTIWERLKQVPTAKENTRHLRDTYNEVASLIASLARLDQQLDNPLMILEVKKKFPKSIWLELNKFAEFTEMQSLLDEIELIITTHESMDSSMAISGVPTGIYTMQQISGDEATDSDPEEGQEEESGQSTISHRNHDRQAYCIFCAKEGHYSSMCHKFTTLEQKKSALSHQRRCFQCLKKGHLSNRCYTKTHCRKCNSEKHPTILCPENVYDSEGTPPRQRSPDEESESSEYWGRNNSYQNSCKREQNDNTLMVASPRILQGNSNKTRIINAIIDTGAMDSFIRQDVADDLKLRKTRSNIPMNFVLFGNKRISQRTDEVQARLIDEKGRVMKCQMLTKKEITAPIQPARLSNADKRFLKKQRINFAESREDREIHMIIGIDQYFKVMQFGKRQYKLPSGKYLVPTCFGYVMCGPQSDKRRPARWTAVNTVIREERNTTKDGQGPEKFSCERPRSAENLEKSTKFTNLHRHELQNQTRSDCGIDSMKTSTEFSNDSQFQRTNSGDPLKTNQPVEKLFNLENIKKHRRLISKHSNDIAKIQNSLTMLTKKYHSLLFNDLQNTKTLLQSIPVAKLADENSQKMFLKQLRGIRSTMAAFEELIEKNFETFSVTRAKFTFVTDCTDIDAMKIQFETWKEMVFKETRDINHLYEMVRNEHSFQNFGNDLPPFNFMFVPMGEYQQALGKVQQLINLQQGILRRQVEKPPRSRFAKKY